MPNSEKPEAPRALKIVALLSTLGACFSVLTIITGLFNNNVRLEFGIVGFWMSAGLLRFDRKWLKWAKRFIWFDLIATDIISLIIATTQPESKFKFGPISMNISSSTALLFFVAMAGVSLWKLRVLTRPEIEELFPDDADPGALLIREASPLRQFGTHMPPQDIPDPAPSAPLKAEPTANSSL